MTNPGGPGKKFDCRLPEEVLLELRRAFYEDKSQGRVKDWGDFMAQRLRDRDVAQGRMVMRGLQS